MSRSASLAIGLSLGLGIAAGCTTCPANDIPGHGYAQGALYLAPDQERVDSLRCRRWWGRPDCQRWYKTNVGEEGTFSVEVNARSADRSPRGFSVVLWDGTEYEELLVRSNAGMHRVQLDREVPPDTYLVSVIAVNDAKAFDFRISVGFEPAPPPPPIPRLAPKFKIHTSSILEQEGYGQDTVAVLIESGREDGLRVGLKGRLVDDGAEIGKLVIEQVYPDGSRARVEGTLLGPVTYETVVEIDVPVGLALEEPEERPLEDGGERP
jgi:hypothetical protein